MSLSRYGTSLWQARHDAELTHLYGQMSTTMFTSIGELQATALPVSLASAPLTGQEAPAAELQEAQQEKVRGYARAIAQNATRINKYLDQLSDLDADPTEKVRAPLRLSFCWQED